MAHKGPAAPSQPRTLRGRSLEIGTLPVGFDGTGTAEYCTQGGHPITPGLPAQMYQEKAPDVSIAGAKPIQTNPIKLGGGT